MKRRCIVTALVLVSAAFTAVDAGPAVAGSLSNPDSCEVTASFTPNAHEYEIADFATYPAQVFTAEIDITHPFVTLELAECHQSGVADGQLQIVAAPGGVPDWGNPLGAVVIPSSQIPDTCVAGVFGDVVFEFPAVGLTAGTQYALVLQAANGDGAIDWRRSSTPEDPSNPYPGGNLWTNGMGGPIEDSNVDLQFAVCGTSSSCNVTASYTPNAHQESFANPDQFLAQVFTAELDINYPFVTLDLSECHSNGSVDARLLIVAAPGGQPDLGDTLGTVVVPSAQIPESCVGGVFGEVVFEFPAVELAAGTQYALVLQEGGGVGAIYWRHSAAPADPGNPYPGGNAWFYLDGEPAEDSPIDFQFAVCGRTAECAVTASYTPNAHESYFANPDQYLAQVFTDELGVDYPFVTLELSECHSNPPTDAQLQIVPAPGGVPDWGNPLGSAVAASDRIPDSCAGGNFGSVVFGFPSVELSEGTQYALVLQAVNGIGAIEWRRSSTPADPSNPYPGGSAWINLEGAGIERPGVDLEFTVCGATNTSGLEVPAARAGSALLYARPEPFNPRTEVTFDLPASGPALLRVYDIAGRRVRTLLDETRPAGATQVAWDGRDDSGRSVASGSYILFLSAGKTRAARRVTLLR